MHPYQDHGEVAELLDKLALDAAHGSSEALDQLLQIVDDQHLAGGVVRRFILNDELVDEATQDTLIAVAESIHKFRGDSKFTTWMYSIARNVAIGHLRRVNPDVSLDTAENSAGASRRLSSVVAERAAIKDAVEQLPSHYRDAVMLRDVERRTYEEIANELGIELNTVRSRLARGRAMLAATILGQRPHG
ncbi:MAG: sigma-70 family RNA polymerase sigma factor [Actinomycetota bacterium]